MKLKGILYVLFTGLMAQGIYANDLTNLVGDWKVIDDKSGFTLVQVNITQQQPYTYQGHIVEAFNPPNHPAQDLSKLKGFHLLHSLKQDAKDPYKLIIGEVVDPAINQRYKVNGKLSRKGNTMILRSPSDPNKASRKLSWVRIR